MCFQAILPMLIGGALSAGGTMMSNRAANRQADDIARARNEELRKTMEKNDLLAMESRDRFDDNQGQYDDQGFKQAEAKALQDRSKPLEAAVTEIPQSAPPISGSAPEVVNSDLARVMSETMAKGKTQAKSMAKLGSYGDTWFNAGVNNAGAGRDIGVTTDAAAGNLSILPYLQDFAQVEATKPISPLGGIMQGIGGAIGGMSGGFLKKPLPKQPTVLPSWGGPR